MLMLTLVYIMITQQCQLSPTIHGERGRSLASARARPERPCYM